MIGFKHDKSEDGNNSVVRILGDIAGRDSARFAKMMEEVSRSGVKTITLDLTRVNYMDSAGLGSLTFNHMELKNKRKRLVIRVKPDSFLFQLFTDTKLATLLNIEETAREAET